MSYTDTERINFLEKVLKQKGEVEPALCYIDNEDVKRSNYFELQLCDSLFTETSLRDAIDRAILKKEKTTQLMKVPCEIWIVGTLLGGEVWMAEGAFFNESDAAEAATFDQFIVLIDVGTMFPAYTTEAKKLYFPKQETWETSELYKIRNQVE